MSKPHCESVLKNTGYRGSDGAVTCSLCDSEMEWAECNECGGDGYFDGFDEDPLWYDEGDQVPCHACHGRGGFYYCDTKECGTVEALRIFNRKPTMEETATLLT